jgi:hypothetical protein
MRPAIALSLLGLSVCCSGCALVEDGARNVCVSMWRPIEEHREKHRNRRWAEAAWQTASCEGAHGSHSGDYAKGFKEGFAEFLFRGGDGEPPLAAPWHYRKLRYQTENGHRAIEDWFAGYRHGAATARDSGARAWVTSPYAPHVASHEPFRVEQPIEIGPLPPPMKEPIEDLPLPRQLPKNTDLKDGDGRVQIEVEPNAMPMPPPFELINAQPTRIKITGVRELPQGYTPVPVEISNSVTPPSSGPTIVNMQPVRAKIMTIRVAPD